MKHSEVTLVRVYCSEAGQQHHRIIDMLHREVYGQTHLEPEQISSMRQSWRKLHNPVKWPLRLKSIMRKN